jgi:hypothetical protein
MMIGNHENFISPYSGFTWSVLKDSGWYGVDLKNSEKFTLGQNQGCVWK